MSRHFLTETQNAATRSLSVGHHPVHDSWDQINAYLLVTLSPSHAALFAEPFRSGDATGWMAASDQTPQPFAQLDPATQDEALTRLRTLLGDIATLSAQLSASARAEDRQWGALLDAIRQQPSKVELTDRLYWAQDQPVLIQWGCRDDQTVLTDTLLRTYAPSPTAVTSETPLHPAPTPGAVPPTAAGTVVETGGWSVLPILLWGLFLATATIIFWLLLMACALNLPPSLRFFGHCNATAAPVEGERHAALRDELAGIQDRLAQAVPCRLPETAQSVPAPEPPALLEEPPAPPLQPAQAPESDIDRARAQAGGQIGDVTVTLLWNGHADLDLLITCPNDQVLSGSTQVTGDGCGGRIDVDANFCASRAGGAGTVCERYDAPAVENPVENGFFTQAEAPVGIYQIQVRHYAASREAPGAPVPFVLEVRRGEDRQRFQETAQPGRTETVTTFDFTQER